MFYLTVYKYYKRYCLEFWYWAVGLHTIGIFGFGPGFGLRGIFCESLSAWKFSTLQDEEDYQDTDQHEGKYCDPEVDETYHRC